MEMLDVGGIRQWTSLNSIGLSQGHKIYSMAGVGNELFVKFHEFNDDRALCSAEVDSDPKLEKWRKRTFIPDGELMTVHLNNGITYMDTVTTSS
ncbi:unnamed protein product [Hymenolepis diminuta]|uniref:Uncharacterized protein n=1 Tax=Hymenolepis diminuta TaxID=6216 RepID=A0A564Y0D2_HYMDI|nr:unnamed protein product [Hymenolepis diminuta]